MGTSVSPCSEALVKIKLVFRAGDGGDCSTLLAASSNAS
jgi:hypothetical protein